MKTRYSIFFNCIKNVSFMVVCLLFSITICAQQKGEMAVGLNLNYGTSTALSNFGLGAKFRWNVSNNLRLEPSFGYYFGKNIESVKYSMWDANVNAHYLFPVGKEKRFTLYPLAGIGILGTSVKFKNDFDELIDGGSYSGSDFAFNIGGGADYLLTDNISVGAEIKYQIVSGWNRPIFTLGATYKF